jgi:hypothetical protein
MTAPNVYELQTAEGKPPIRVVDLGQQAPTAPVAPPAAGQWIERGQPFIEGEDDVPPRLNMSEAGMTKYLNDAQASLNAANHALEAAYSQVASTFGRLDDAATWDAAEKGNPRLVERVRAAEQAALKASRITKTAAAAVASETAAAPLKLASRDESRAATLLPLVSKTVETAPLAEIRDAFRVAMANDDPANLYLFATLVPARLRRKPELRDDGTTERRDDPRIVTELQTMVSAVRDKLKDDSLSALHKRAQGLKVGAGQVGFDAGTRRRALEMAKTGDVRREGF